MILLCKNKTMKNFFHLSLLVALLTVLPFSCTKTGQDWNSPSFPDDGDEVLYHDAIVLGDRLENPYALENVKSAYVSLYPTKSRDDLSTTDYYVRFLPKDDDQLTLLRNMGLTLVDHPVDYEILREGDYYHDPGIDDQKITWQYAVVPVDFSFPSGIEYEILESCYIAPASDDTKASAIDWNAVEAESFRLTGNADMLAPQTKGESRQPSGYITITDPSANGGQPVGVAGVQVMCNVFVKFSSTYTDEKGFYRIPKSFSANPRYRLVFKNKKGFTIGLNTILFPASVSTLGRHSSSGVDLTVDADSDRKLFRRCVVNNAARDFYMRCGEGDLNIAEPPSNLCFWMFDNLNASSAIMLHHGTVLSGDYETIYFQVLSFVVKLFGPDITLGTKNCSTYKEIADLVNHEMAHACHFARVGKDYWNEYISYIAKCTLQGQDTYGDGTLDGAGRCAVGEMWGYYLQSKMHKDRYGGSNPSFGSQYWFHPQILSSVEDRGIKTSEIFKAIASGVTSTEELRNSLVAAFPGKKNSINQIFNRYE